MKTDGISFYHLNKLSLLIRAFYHSKFNAASNGVDPFRCNYLRVRAVIRP